LISTFQPIENYIYPFKVFFIWLKMNKSFSNG